VSSSRTGRIAGGFIAILVLVAVLAGNALLQMALMERRLKTITDEHNVKTHLIHVIQDHIRLRQISIRNMLLTTDLFDRSDEAERFYAYAVPIAESRAMLVTMPLSDDERRTYERLDQHMREAYIVQNQLVEHAVAAESIRESSRRLRVVHEKLLEVVSVLNELGIMQRTATGRAVQEARDAYRNARVVLFAFGFATLLIGFLIAYNVVRTTRIQQQAVDAAMDDLRRNNELLEERVAARTQALELARDQALASTRVKSQFVANMSHELRTPLNAIIGYAEMLDEELSESGDKTLLPDVNHILVAARQLLRLVNDVLDLAKVEAGKMDFQVDRFDVAEFLADVATSATPLVTRNRNTLHIDAPAGLAAMQSDPARLRQILVNLIGNAGKFTEGGRITVRGERYRQDNADWLAFSVKDTGIGIEPDKTGALFQEFMQLDSSATRRFEGTGLGLAIAQRLVFLLGGLPIEVDSQPGKGTTFTVRLPAEIAHQQRRATD
jgi:signal transduction histidine kinase